MLSNQELSKFKERLQAAKNEAENRMDQNDHFDLDRAFWKESMGELSNYDNHPADAGTELYEREKDIALNEHAETELININRALDAIANGSYGKCEVCGKEIPIERLEALPTTIFCIEHSQDQETSHRRPVEEEIMGPPFKKFFKDDDPEESVVFDAEDSWQEVANWGTSETPSDLSYPTGDYNDVYIDAEENVGYVENYENFVGVDMEGKVVVYPNAQHEQYEAALDQEGIMTTFGDLPAYEHDPYVEEDEEKQRNRE